MLMKFMENLVSLGGTQGASQGGSSSARLWCSAATAHASFVTLNNGVATSQPGANGATAVPDF